MPPMKVVALAMLFVLAACGSQAEAPAPAQPSVGEARAVADAQAMVDAPRAPAAQPSPSR